MARVRTFHAWRYASDTADITALTAPPYDVISTEQREALASLDPHNVVGLELPPGPLDPSATDNRYRNGRANWRSWTSDGTLARDETASLYVVEQRFELAGRSVSRRAFIVEVGLEPFDAGVVIPHERTLPKALGDRFELIKACGANFSQVFGLFDDPACETDAAFDAAMATEPVAVATDSDGVVSTLWRLEDDSVATQLSEFMASKQVFIADGHHRYTTALAYRDHRREQALSAGETPADPAYDWVMMALVNMDDPDLAVMGYNRIVDGPVGFDPAAFKQALSERFELSELAPGHPDTALDGHERPAFLLRTTADQRPLLAVLREDVDLNSAIPGDHSPAWKSLDVAVLQELVLWPLLGVHPDKPETLDRLSFTKDAHAAFKAVGTHDVAFVLRPTRLDQLRAVSLSGETMPQKSTYFYPKLLSGLVFRSAD